MRPTLATALIGAIVGALVAATTTASAAPPAEQVFVKRLKKIAGERPTPLSPADFEQALRDSKAVCVCLESVRGLTNRAGAVVFVRGVGLAVANCLVVQFDGDGAVDQANTEICPGQWVPITK